MDPADIEKIFEKFQLQNPKPVTELNSKNHFTLLVAVILSAQSTDSGVNKATQALFDIASTPESMLNLGEEGLKQYIKTIGLFNSKAKNIIRMSKILIDRYNSQVPSSFEALTSLPGVGSKTAKVILNAAFHKPEIAVDTHVFRTAIRIGLSKGKTVKAVEKELTKTIPIKWQANAHHWLVLHGRYICKARKPLCEECIINKYCNYYTSAHVSNLMGTKRPNQEAKKT